MNGLFNLMVRKFTNNSTSSDSKNQSDIRRLIYYHSSIDEPYMLLTQNCCNLVEIGHNKQIKGSALEEQRDLIIIMRLMPFLDLKSCMTLYPSCSLTPIF